MHYSDERERANDNSNSVGLQLSLPYPPTINHYYGHKKGGGKFIKLAGWVFRKSVAVLVRQQKANLNLTENLSIRVEAYPPDNRKRDIDNILKALLDSLTFSRVYKDDSQVKFLVVEMKEPVKDGLVSVNIVSNNA